MSALFSPAPRQHIASIARQLNMSMPEGLPRGANYPCYPMVKDFGVS